MARQRLACIFVALFHQRNNIMQISFLAIALIIRSFMAIEQAPDHTGSIGCRGHQIEEQVSVPEATDVVLQSVDGGLSWQGAGTGLPADVHAYAVLADDDEVLLGAYSGLYRSNTALSAPAWQREFFMNDNITGIFPGQAGPYVVCYNQGFFQNLTGTDIWMPVHNNLEDKSVYAVLENGAGALFVGCESGIFKSVDQGNTWLQVYNGPRVTSLAVANGVLVGSTTRGILRSTDAGEHWDWALNSNEPSLSVRHIREGFVTILQGDRTFEPVKINELMLSTDGGASWQRMSESLPEALRDVYALEEVGEYLFACSENGIFRSEDRGKTWKHVLAAPAGKGDFFKLSACGKSIFTLVINGC
ncbi:MAG: hypothetical protein KDC70_04135 [Saprospiraceae bacterium]|nr:hypothetical protein [Saprospiraceae bacterium]